MISERQQANVLAVLQRIENVLGMPPSVQQNAEAADGFYDEYIRALAGFDAVTLRKAGDKALRSCKWWPKPAELVEFCEEAMPQASSGDSEAHRRIKARDDMVKQAARDYLLRCPSSLVDMALRQGWGRSLEDIARGVIRGCYERDGKMPTEAMLMALRLPKADVEYYARNGQAHIEVDHAQIVAARRSGGLSQTSKRMTGEVNDQQF